MNHHVSLLPASLVLMLAASAAAQGQTLTFGVSPGQTTSGTASGGGTGNLGVAIGGFGTIPVTVPPGTSSLGVATALAAALQASGFAAQQNGTEVTVTAGPGGAPLTQGGGIGSTDTGITGVKAKVEPNSPPGQKQNGANVPKADPAAQANQGGSIQVDVEVRKRVGGVWTLLWIQIVVPVFPGDTGATVNVRVKQMLEAQGCHVNHIQLPASVAPITPAPSFGLDRTTDGGRVQGVQVQPQGGARQLLPRNGAGAGQVPAFGAAEFDQPLHGNGFVSDDRVAWNGPLPVLGTAGSLDAFVTPDRFGAWTITVAPATPVFQAPIVPLPFAGPAMYLPIDPLQALLFFDVTSPLGTMQLPLAIPLAPPIAGLDLRLQALTLDPAAPDLLGSMRRTQGLSVRIGQ
jgi:hypothetical protein